MVDMPEKEEIIISLTTTTNRASTATKDNITYRIFSPNADDGTQTNAPGVWGVFYVSGNYFDDSCSKLSSKSKTNIAKTNADNWVGIHPNTNNGALPGGNIENIKSPVEFETASTTTHTAIAPMKKYWDYVGASLKREVIDARVISDVEMEIILSKVLMGAVTDSLIHKLIVKVTSHIIRQLSLQTVTMTEFPMIGQRNIFHKERPTKILILKPDTVIWNYISTAW